MGVLFSLAPQSYKNYFVLRKAAFIQASWDFCCGCYFNLARATSSQGFKA
jgi:hypothetical protein